MEEAIASVNLESIREFLEDGYDPNSTNQEGTPLIFLTENIQILELLLIYGADPKKPDENGFQLADYTEDQAILALLNSPREIVAPKKKFSKYRGTIRAKSQRAKTRRREPRKQTAL